MEDISRRQFVGVSAATLAAAMLPRVSEAAAVPHNQVILFQGDSVTDTFRNRTVSAPNEYRALGSGYAFIIASAALREHPTAGLSFLNRGVSGNKVPDLEARWQADTIDLKPDILSVLIGVNDFWHTMLNGYTGTLETYEARYRALLQGTVQKLPKVKIVVLEPFALRGQFVDDRWYPAFAGYQAAAKRVATTVGATFIPLQSAFDKAAVRTGPQYWAADGVHPTPAGHELIAERWRKAVGI